MNDLKILKTRYANKKAVVVCDKDSTDAVYALKADFEEVIVYSSRQMLAEKVSRYAYDDSVYIVIFDSVPVLPNDSIYIGTETFSLSGLKSHLKNLPKVPCQLRQLHVDENGTVYPCYKLLGTKQYIGDITDKNIVEKIYNYKLPDGCFCNKCQFSPADDKTKNMSLKRIYLEMGGACQAKCLYCFQQAHENFRMPYTRHKELLQFCKIVPHDEMVIGGGEVLIQNKTLDFLKQYLASITSKVRINTNGSVPLSRLDEIENLFDIVNVTFNGFTYETTKALMDVDLKYAKEIAENLSRNKKVRLGLKFLASPLCIADLPSFLKWAIDLSPYRINVKIAEICHLKTQSENMWNGSSFSKLNLGYWQPIFDRVGTETEAIIQSHAKKIKSEKIRFSLQEGLIPLLKLSNNTIKLADITFVC